jgi:hypothetical protein
MAPIIQTELGRSNAIEDQRRFGRRYAPDPRDRLHPMAARLAAMPRALLKVRTQAPQRGPTLDQGDTPECVMYSAATSLGALPVGYGRTAASVLKSVQVPVEETNLAGPVAAYPDLYHWAQAHDEWPGEDYDGTSVRAGQEYLKLVGRSTGYVWATSADEAKDYVKRVGSAPIILGVDWLDAMNSPRKIGGSYYLDVGGPVVGGHAICCLWFDRVKKAWKLQNSWGTGWADNGVAYLPDDGFNYLVFQANGEAVSYVEAAA